jgi:hypothetical protein
MKAKSGFYSGGCSCRQVRFVVSDVLYVLACHCDACKKRTGSAFGLSAVVEQANVREFQGTTTTYVRTAESGKPVHYEFCPFCGTTVRWGIQAVPERQIFAAGAFDDPRAFRAAGEMYVERALPWARLGCDLVRAGEPDHEFRRALIAKTEAI